MITPADLKKKMEAKNGAVNLLDIRDSGRYREKHIPGAANIPLGPDFLAEFQKLFKDKDAFIVGYDEHEGRPEAQETCLAAEQFGYTNVSCLQGGLMAWMEAGGAVEFGQES